MIAAIKSLFTRRKENPCSRICGIKPKPDQDKDRQWQRACVAAQQKGDRWGK
jgi:hypothetical protein